MTDRSLLHLVTLSNWQGEVAPVVQRLALVAAALRILLDGFVGGAILPGTGQAGKNLVDAPIEVTRRGRASQNSTWRNTSTWMT